MARIDLTARARNYSVYLPSMQVASAKRVCMESAQWSDLTASLGLEPADFNYLDPSNRFWSYTCALASAETFRKSKNNAITSRHPSSFILGDSGGFQFGKGSGATSKWRGYTERQVTDAWRASALVSDITDWCELHCDGAMTLDLPLWVRRTANAGTPFHRCSVRSLLNLTIENLDYLQRRPDKVCKHLNVLQGDSPADEDHWYRAVKRYKFDGWSFAGGVGVDGGPYRILRRLLIMRDDKLLDPGFDWLHILKLSQFPWAPMMTAIQRAVRRFVKNREFIVTFDSSTPYQAGGHREQYFETRPFTSDRASWTNPPHKFPSTFGNANANTRTPLCTTRCSKKALCSMCARGKPHLPAPLMSPIAKTLHLEDVVTNRQKYVKRRVGALFDELILNHNVYTVVDGIIRANEAVFGTTKTAPARLIEAVGLIENDLFKKQNWHSFLNQNRLLFENAVGF